MPPYVAFMTSRSHLAFGGYLGKQYDPFIANQAAQAAGLHQRRRGHRAGRPAADFFRLPAGLSHRAAAGPPGAADGPRRPAPRARPIRGRSRRWTVTGSRRSSCWSAAGPSDAFDLSSEPRAVRDRYGKHLWCQQALLARRLVEAGVAFVTLDLSYHTASGTWDTHGDNIPPYGGISKGLRPLLPLFDHLITTLVGDLDERGLLDDVLVIAMGEFGRTPMMGTQGSTDGRNHWPVVMSMAPGRRRPAARPGDRRRPRPTAATSRTGPSPPATSPRRSTTTWASRSTPPTSTRTGRPRSIVEHGEPIAELF